MATQSITAGLRHLPAYAPANKRASHKRDRHTEMISKQQIDGVDIVRGRLEDICHTAPPAAISRGRQPPYRTLQLETSPQYTYHANDSVSKSVEAKARRSHLPSSRFPPRGPSRGSRRSSFSPLGLCLPDCRHGVSRYGEVLRTHEMERPAEEVPQHAASCRELINRHHYTRSDKIIQLRYGPHEARSHCRRSPPRNYSIMCLSHRETQSLYRAPAQ